MDNSLVRFVSLLVAVACVFIIILGIQSDASVINSITFHHSFYQEENHE